MKSIEVLVNGKRLCVAGSGAPDFTFANLTVYDGNPTVVGSLLVAGQRGKNVVSWLGDYRLEQGDEVLLRIVEVA